MKMKLNCVMLIDDDEPTNFLSQMVVAEAGCAKSIEIATSGEHALQYLTRANESPGFSRPELILLDINMPAMNGWEFLEKYKKLNADQKANVVIIMLTTSINPDDRWKSQSLPDIAGFESKPLTRQKLEDILKKFFPEVKAEDGWMKSVMV